jgi:hypothetical protein
MLGDKQQSILVAELTNPPEKVSPEQLPYVFRLAFSTLGANNFPDHFHLFPRIQPFARRTNSVIGLYSNITRIARRGKS